MKATTDECAHAILEVAPAIMRTIRTEMRSHRTPDLSIPQFRALNGTYQVARPFL